MSCSSSIATSPRQTFRKNASFFSDTPVVRFLAAMVVASDEVGENAADLYVTSVFDVNGDD